MTQFNKLTRITTETVGEAIRILRPYGISVKPGLWFDYHLAARDSMTGRVCSESLCLACPVGAVAFASWLRGQANIPHLRLNKTLRVLRPVKGRLMEDHVMRHLNRQFGEEYVDGFVEGFDSGRDAEPRTVCLGVTQKECANFNRGMTDGQQVRRDYFAGKFRKKKAA